MPRRSSRAWYARPTARPNEDRASTSAPGPSPSTAPSAADVETKAAVLRSAIRSHRSKLASPLDSSARSSAWPSIRSCTVRSSRRAAAGPDGADSTRLAADEEGAAGQDGESFTEDYPGAGSVPPGAVAVHDVVVEQGEVVHQLDRDGSGHSDLQRGARRGGREQHEGGAHRLATAERAMWVVRSSPAEVVGDDRPDLLGEGGDLGPQGPGHQVRAVTQELGQGGRCHPVPPTPPISRMKPFTSVAARRSKAKARSEHKRTGPSAGSAGRRPWEPRTGDGSRGTTLIV